MVIDEHTAHPHGRRMTGAVLFGLILVLALSGTVFARPALASSTGGLDSSDSAIETDIPALVAVDSTLDGQQVTITGEAVGTAFSGDDADHRWVNITADGSTIGVYMSAEDADSIANFGSYGVTGSTVTVTGTYHVACDEGHAGELDIHAQSVSIADEGGTTNEPDPSFARWFGASVILAIGLLLLGANLFLYRTDR